MKKRRGKNGLTKSEYANQEFIAARDRLFDTTMANIAKKKAKVEEGQPDHCASLNEKGIG